MRGKQLHENLIEFELERTFNMSGEGTHDGGVGGRPDKVGAPRTPAQVLPPLLPYGNKRKLNKSASSPSPIGRHYTGCHVGKLRFVLKMKH